MAEKFDIVLLEKIGETGLNKSEIIALSDMLLGEESYPVEIGDINGISSAMGFITRSAAQKLQLEYDQHSELGKFVRAILDDSTLESENSQYVYGSLKIWLGRNLPTNMSVKKDDPLLELIVMQDDIKEIMTNNADCADKNAAHGKILSDLECAIQLVQKIYDELDAIDAGDFSKCMSTSVEKTMFASVATYTGDGSVNAVLFTSEAAARADCKKQFESSVVEGKENGDIDPNMESIWHDDEMYGAVYWDDSNTSTFEVKALVLHDSDDTNSDNMVIPTPAGDLRIYKSKVSERLGCHIMLYPKDCDEEIDVVTVLTEENAPEDIGIYVYDNPSEEDYQLHTILQRKDVVQSQIHW